MDERKIRPRTGAGTETGAVAETGTGTGMGTRTRTESGRVDQRRRRCRKPYKSCRGDVGNGGDLG